MYGIPYTGISRTAHVNVTTIEQNPGNYVIQIIGVPHDSLQPQSVVTTVCNNDKYRYGFNGKLKNNEIAGVGNDYDYGVRNYQPRIARFISTDPLTKKYPWYTPYQFAGNTPIQAADLDGLEPLKMGVVSSITLTESKPVVEIASVITVKIQILNVSSMADDKIEYSAIKGYMNELASDMTGVKTGEVPNAFSLDIKTGKAVNQNYNNTTTTTYSSSVKFDISIVKSVDELTNDAVVIGLADNIQGGEDYGIANEFTSIAFVKASLMDNENINNIGGKVIKHELGHLFGAQHNSNSSSVMSTTKYDRGRNVK